DTLTVGHFYVAKHGLIFEAIMRLFEANTPADLITVSTALSDSGQLESVGGSAYVADLVNGVPSAANIEHYADIIKQAYIRRRLIEVSAEMSDKSFDVKENLSEV